MPSATLPGFQRNMASLSPSSAHLLSLIKHAVVQIEAEYTSRGQETPSVFGGDLKSSRESFPDGNIPSLQLLQGINLLKAATGQLLAELVPAPMILFSMACAPQEIACLGTLTEAKVADIIHEIDPTNSTGVTVEQLAERCGLEAGKLSRLLRFLATRHIFLELRPNVFTNNKLSEPLRGSSPNSFANVIKHWCDNSARGTLELSHTLLDPQLGHSYDEAHCAAMKAFNGVAFFERMKKEPVKARRFDGAMRELESNISFAKAFVEDYPWYEIEQKQGLLVDVGGGSGAATLAISEKLPKDWEFVVEDLDHVIHNSTTPVWTSAKSSGVKHRLIPHDFFEPQPVKNAEVYILKFIIHDFPDQESITILKHIRDAAGPNSRLLVVDAVIEPATPTKEKYPMLSNGGFASDLAHCMDMQMLIGLNAQERTRKEFEVLLEQAGWKLKKTIKLRSAINTHVVEATPI